MGCRACYSITYLQFLTVISQNVRLKDGDASYQGRLEIKYNGEWGTVCNKNFSNLAAEIVCKELGLQSYSILNHVIPGPRGGRIWLENVQCNGNEQSIFNCSHNGWGQTNCSHEDDVGVSCTGTYASVYSYII